MVNYPARERIQLKEEMRGRILARMIDVEDPRIAKKIATEIVDRWTRG